MIKTVKYTELEESFFKGRDFENSANETVKSVLEEVQKKGDAALRIYGNKFDVSVPASFEVPQEELKAAAEKLMIQNRDLYDALVYSHTLALDFAKKQRESFKDFEAEMPAPFFDPLR